jgi:hypothetical protein
VDGAKAGRPSKESTERRVVDARERSSPLYDESKQRPPAQAHDAAQGNALANVHGFIACTVARRRQWS